MAVSPYQPEMSHAEIGEELGLSRERVRQIEKSALKKMRAHFARLGLTPTTLDLGEDWAPGIIVHLTDWRPE